MSAVKIKELRDRTFAGFLDCKKALEASDWDMEKAIEWLKEKGAAKAAKKAGNIAAEGITNIVSNDSQFVIYELNSQTDFVVENKEFLEFADKIGAALLANEFNNIEEALNISTSDGTVSDIVTQATAKIGEKIVLRRAIRINKEAGNAYGLYVHNNKRISSVMITKGGNDETARFVAMHVASMNPEFLDESQVPSETVKTLKDEIINSDSLQGKPDNIKEQISQGMLRKKLSELTLVDQEFVMEKMPVKKYLSNVGATALTMIRFEVGEGIEKVETDFAAEVAAQMGS